MSSFLYDIENPNLQTIKNSAGTQVMSFDTAPRIIVASGVSLTQDMGGAYAQYAKVMHFTYAPSTPGAWANKAFFTVDDSVTIIAINVTYSTNSTVAANLNVTVDADGIAPGAGTAILTDNANAGIDISAAGQINTQQVGTINGDTLFLIPGDKLSLKFSGAPAGLDGLLVHISYVEGAVT